MVQKQNNPQSKTGKTEDWVVHRLDGSTERGGINERFDLPSDPEFVKVYGEGTREHKELKLGEVAKRVDFLQLTKDVLQKGINNPRGNKQINIGFNGGQAYEYNDGTNYYGCNMPAIYKDTHERVHLMVEMTKLSAAVGVEHCQPAHMNSISNREKHSMFEGRLHPHNAYAAAVVAVYCLTAGDSCEKHRDRLNGDKNPLVAQLSALVNLEQHIYRTTILVYPRRSCEDAYRRFLACRETVQNMVRLYSTVPRHLKPQRQLRDYGECYNRMGEHGICLSVQLKSSGTEHMISSAALLNQASMDRNVGLLSPLVTAMVDVYNKHCNLTHRDLISMCVVLGHMSSFFGYGVVLHKMKEMRNLETHETAGLHVCIAQMLVEEVGKYSGGVLPRSTACYLDPQLDVERVARELTFVETLCLEAKDPIVADSAERHEQAQKLYTETAEKMAKRLRYCQMFSVGKIISGLAMVGLLPASFLNCGCFATGTNTLNKSVARLNAKNKALVDHLTSGSDGSKEEKAKAVMRSTCKHIRTMPGFEHFVPGLMEQAQCEGNRGTSCEGMNVIDFVFPGGRMMLYQPENHEGHGTMIKMWPIRSEDGWEARWRPSEKTKDRRPPPHQACSGMGSLMVSLGREKNQTHGLVQVRIPKHELQKVWPQVLDAFFSHGNMSDACDSLSKLFGMQALIKHYLKHPEPLNKDGQSPFATIAGERSRAIELPSGRSALEAIEITEDDPQILEAGQSRTLLPVPRNVRFSATTEVGEFYGEDSDSPEEQLLVTTKAAMKSQVFPNEAKGGTKKNLASLVNANEELLVSPTLVELGGEPKLFCLRYETEAKADSFTCRWGDGKKFKLRDFINVKRTFLMLPLFSELKNAVYMPYPNNAQPTDLHKKAVAAVCCTDASHDIVGRATYFMHEWSGRSNVPFFEPDRCRIVDGIASGLRGMKVKCKTGAKIWNWVFLSPEQSKLHFGLCLLLLGGHPEYFKGLAKRIIGRLKLRENNPGPCIVKLTMDKGGIEKVGPFGCLGICNPMAETGDLEVMFCCSPGQNAEITDTLIWYDVTMAKPFPKFEKKTKSRKRKNKHISKLLHLASAEVLDSINIEDYMETGETTAMDPLMQTGEASEEAHLKCESGFI